MGPRGEPPGTLALSPPIPKGPPPGAPATQTSAPGGFWSICCSGRRGSCSGRFPVPEKGTGHTVLQGKCGLSGQTGWAASLPATYQMRGPRRVASPVPSVRPETGTPCLLAGEQDQRGQRGRFLRRSWREAAAQRWGCGTLGFPPHPQVPREQSHCLLSPVQGTQTSLS